MCLVRHALTIALLFGCGTSKLAPERTIEPQPFAAEREVVERFFGQPFPHAFAITKYPSRAALVARVPEMTQCWAVGHGTASEVALLDPAVWKRDACEHDLLAHWRDANARDHD
jgi:hypothetical protein